MWLTIASGAKTWVIPKHAKMAGGSRFGENWNWKGQMENTSHDLESPQYSVKEYLLGWLAEAGLWCTCPGDTQKSILKKKRQRGQGHPMFTSHSHGALEQYFLSWPCIRATKSLTHPRPASPEFPLNCGVQETASEHSKDFLASYLFVQGLFFLPEQAAWFSWQSQAGKCFDNCATCANLIPSPYHLSIETVSESPKGNIIYLEFRPWYKYIIYHLCHIAYIA